MPDQIAQQTQSEPQADPKPEHKKPKEQPYEKVDRPFWKILVYNFFGGIAWGFGVLIGTTAILALIAFFINKNVDLVPVLGHFFAEVLKSAQNSLVPQGGNVPPLQ